MKTHKDYVPTAGWELDFTNPPRNPPPHVACAECGQPMLRADAAQHSSPSQGIMYFCPTLVTEAESCHNKWYMTQLRKDGL